MSIKLVLHTLAVVIGRHWTEFINAKASRPCEITVAKLYMCVVKMENSKMGVVCLLILSKGAIRSRVP